MQLLLFEAAARPERVEPARVSDEAPAADRLAARLLALGLPPFERIVAHRNRQVMLSWIPGRRLRVHEGYADAPDGVLAAIVRFVTPGTKRAARLAARREFLGYPVEDHAPAPPRPDRPEAERPGDAVLLAELRRLHLYFNQRHFEGRLGEIQIRLSSRMRRRLGELRLDSGTGRAVSISLSRRHLRRDGAELWRDTLLHEMVHQWQAETGRPVDHGREFRLKARAVGIDPRAVRRD
ncbi:MAG TPA: SprT-like domain-containing protein [Gemmatimonadales bacterium]|nr:SprT-like domain-containing protein [Gemmatimonadales bacterium]